MQHNAAFGVIVVLLACANVIPMASAKSGGVLIADGVLLWGQYRVHRNVIGIAEPLSTQSQTASDLRDAAGPAVVPPQVLPSYGAAVSVVHCQHRGSTIFRKDGEVSTGGLAELRRRLATLSRFDMLPILILFNPTPECRLESAEAYRRAANGLLVDVLRDYWLVVCVTDHVDSPQWRQGSFLPDTMELVKDSCSAARSIDSHQVVAAGGTADAVSRELLEHTGINLIMRRTDGFRPEGVERFGTVPVVDVVAPAALEDASRLAAAVRRVFDMPSYGFVIDVAAARAHQGVLQRELDLLGNAVAMDQVQRSRAVPLNPADRHSLAAGEHEDGFVSLFNGRDLAGWVPITEPGDFVVRDQAIVLKRRTGGWLRSWNSYGDFIFRCEYKIARGGNSGIYFRSPLVGRQSRIGFEFQVMGDAAGADVNSTSSGSLYEVRAPDRNTLKRDDWNDVEVTCVGEHIQVVWNGQLVHDVHYPDEAALQGRSKRGYIGLQDHHNPVEFRKLRIKSLTKRGVRAAHFPSR
jgi:hypothetical protein